MKNHECPGRGPLCQGQRMSPNIYRKVKEGWSSEDQGWDGRRKDEMNKCDGYLFGREEVLSGTHRLIIGWRLKKKWNVS